MHPVGAANKVKMKNYNHNDYIELPETNAFKYPRNTIDQNGGHGAKVARRIEVA